MINLTDLDAICFITVLVSLFLRLLSSCEFDQSDYKTEETGFKKKQQYDKTLDSV